MKHKQEHGCGGFHDVRPHQAAGLTMVEIIVASVVFSMAIIVVTTLLTTLQAAQRNTYYLSIATHAAQSQLERIRSSQFDTVTNGQVIPGSSLPAELQNGAGTIGVSTNASVPDSKLITVTITYTVDGRAKTLRMTTLIDPPEVAGS